MKTVSFSTLMAEDQNFLQEAVSRLSHSLNKVSNPQTSAIAVTQKDHYYGNNIFLSNCTLFCAEAMAISASVTAKDNEVIKLYLTSGRGDTKAPKLITPCGNCRQILHDFAHLHQNTIKVFCATNELDQIIVTSSAELLPEGFRSASLGKMAS